MACLTLLPILLPVLGAAILVWRRPWHRAARQRLVLTVSGGVFLLVLVLAVWGREAGLVLLSFGEGLSLRLELDGLGAIFALMAALLWLPASVYAFSYMTHEGHEDRFFTFWLLALGMTMGVALAANPVTMYLFYEGLTLSTLPLVMHTMDDAARSAGKKYICYSMGGAALGFCAVVYLSLCAPGGQFALGGFLPEELGELAPWLLPAFAAAFFGFGAKAAVFPLHGWLPAAGVAPTPVTALLHAVAVVKAGVFAILRMSWYSFGPERISGTWAQQLCLAAAVFTVVYGAVMALRSTHLKRRLAYSTVANLSGILFGAMLLTPAGLSAAVIHMLNHAALKITLFFCAGAIYFTHHKSYVHGLEGYARAMPVTFGCYVTAAVGLMGLPPLGGFLGKYLLGSAGAASGLALGYAGCGALAASSFLSALYLLSVAIPAYYPPKDAEGRCPAVRQEAPRVMTGVLCALAGGGVLLGFFTGPLLEFLGKGL